jgi:hypothetical protein
MYRSFVAPLILLLLTAPTGLAAQHPLLAFDSSSAVLAGQRAGMQQGQTAGVGVAISGSAAATLLLTPYVAGAGSLITAMVLPGTPTRVPQVVPVVLTSRFNGEPAATFFSGGRVPAPRAHH